MIIERASVEGAFSWNLRSIEQKRDEISGFCHNPMLDASLKEE